MSESDRRGRFYMGWGIEGEAAAVSGVSPCDSGMFPKCYNKRESGFDRERCLILEGKGAWTPQGLSCSAPC